MIQERSGSRYFEKRSRWNVIDYTVISSNNINAKYGDKVGSDTNRLFLTYFKFGEKVYPLNRFKKLDTPVMLEDLTRLTLKDSESNYWLEMNETKDKVRVYEEIHCDGGRLL